MVAVFVFIPFPPFWLALDGAMQRLQRPGGAGLVATGTASI
jgi:hypothetical protein